MDSRSFTEYKVLSKQMKCLLNYGALCNETIMFVMLSLHLRRYRCCCHHHHRCCCCCCCLFLLFFQPRWFSFCAEKPNGLRHRACVFWWETLCELHSPKYVCIPVSHTAPTPSTNVCNVFCFCMFVTNLWNSWKAVLCSTRMAIRKWTKKSHKTKTKSESELSTTKRNS